ncbi:MAG: threonine--tRNA ligase [Dehalococcoidia bacterium]|nr:threonine--tRNA ligase [Dehalococcoidia bacterium]
MSREERLYRMRHSAAHIMAQAVLEKFPGGRIGVGPPIDWGFYYDFELPRALTPDDLPEIEARMREIMAQNVRFERRELDAAGAREMFKDQPYKLELIDGILAGGLDEYGEPVAEAPTLSTYRQDGFEDLCQGPHVAGSEEIPLAAFKLMSVAGAYWRGDEKRPQLTRIYGALFESEQELGEHLERLEEAKRRDHKVLGHQLDLYSTHPEYGPGLIYWHPKGGRIRKVVEDFWRNEHLRNGYEIVFTPHIGKGTLWETSGHLVNYAENMYSPMDIDGQEYYIKPMNCPFHIQIYKSDTRSYRDLPIRLAELGTVYRYERSGTLDGLLRVRGFTQDDAHLFCRPDQMKAELEKTVDFLMFFFGSLGFDRFQVYLSVRDEKGKYVGRAEDWEAATDTLRDVVESRGLPYEVDRGGAVFYGPKIDVKIKDALGREWQCSTIQFDFNLPERFDVEFVGEDGAKHRPYMIHRALLGSMERFFGVLIEHYAGAFPLWLAPVQAVVIPIADRHVEYAQKVADELRRGDLRIEVDQRPERMNAKIRHAQLQKVPYMLVVGDREAEAAGAAVRLRSGEDLGTLPLSDIRERMLMENRPA